jgi:hypothetical protein
MRLPVVCAIPLLLGGAISFSLAQTTDLSAPQAASSQVQDSKSSTSSSKGTAAAEAQHEKSQADAVDKRTWRLRLSGVSVGAGYTHFSGPIYPYYYPFPYGYAPYGFYPGDWVSASLWYPLWGPTPFYGPGYFNYNGGRGAVRLTANPKDARVYIDGGYAGPADKLKDIWLDPGAYDLTVSASGHEDFHQRLYVLSGKSVKIAVRLAAADVKEKP